MRHSTVVDGANFLVVEFVTSFTLLLMFVVDLMYTYFETIPVTLNPDVSITMNIIYTQLIVRFLFRVESTRVAQKTYCKLKICKKKRSEYRK